MRQFPIVQVQLTMYLLQEIDSVLLFLYFSCTVCTNRKKIALTNFMLFRAIVQMLYFSFHSIHPLFSYYLRHQLSMVLEVSVHGENCKKN